MVGAVLSTTDEQCERYHDIRRAIPYIVTRTPVHGTADDTYNDHFLLPVFFPLNVQYQLLSRFSIKSMGATP